MSADRSERSRSSVGELVRSWWRFTSGGRWQVAAAAVLLLGLFGVSAWLPLLTGRLLDTALIEASASARSDEFVAEWLALHDSTRLVVARETADAVDVDSVALGVQAASSQAIAARADHYVDWLFPSGLSYDVSGPLGQRLRAQVDDSSAGWVHLVRGVLDDGTLTRGEMVTLGRPNTEVSRQDAADAFSFVVAGLSLEDAATQQRDDWRRSAFVRGLLWFGALVVVVAALRFTTLRLSLAATFNATRRMQDAVFAQVHDSALVDSGVLSRSSMIGRCTNYVEKVQAATTGLFTKGVPALANLVLSAVILLAINAKIGVLMCTLVGAFEVVRRLVSPRWSALVHSSLDDKTRLGELADDAITHRTAIRAAGAESRLRATFTTRAEATRRAAVRIDTFSEGFDFAAFTVAQAGLLISVGVIGFAGGATSLGAAAASILYVKAMSDAIGDLPRVLVSLQEAAPYMHRLNRVLSHGPRRVVMESGPAAAAARRDAVLVLDDVTFSPHDGGGGCRRVDLAVDRGTVHAVVGAQRSAVMALLHMASGLDVPDSGVVAVDGVDLRTLDLDTLRRTVALVDADPYVADATVADNLRLLRPGATDEEMEAVVRSVGLAAWVASLPSGMGTTLGRTGHHTPRRERALLAIGRALVSGAPVVIVDDPTTTLDRVTAAEVWERIRALAIDHAVLVATTRLDEVDAGDTVSVLVDGGVVESGGAGQLLAQGRHWPALWTRHRGGGDPVAGLRSIPALAHLSDATLERASRRLMVESYADGAVVFDAGDASDRLFVVVSGVVELWDADRRVASLHEGDHFGEFDPRLDEAGDDRRRVTARASGSVTVRSLHRSALAGGAAQVLDGSADQRAVYRLLARHGAMTAGELAGLLPEVDVEECLAWMTSVGAVVAAAGDDGRVWRIAAGARGTARRGSALLGALEGV